MRVSRLLDLVGLKAGWRPDPWYFDRGTANHAATVINDRGLEFIEGTLDPVCVPYLEGWKKFMAEMRPEILPGAGLDGKAIEEHLESIPYGLTGTLDRRFILHGHRVCEIKSGGPESWHRWQVSLYRLLWVLQNPGQAAPLGMAVYLPGDGNYKCAWFDDRRDVDRAKAIIEFGKIMEECV